MRHRQGLAAVIFFTWATADAIEPPEHNFCETESCTAENGSSLIQSQHLMYKTILGVHAEDNETLENHTREERPKNRLTSGHSPEGEERWPPTEQVASFIQSSSKGMSNNDTIQEKW